MLKETPRILIVDDEQVIRDLLKRALGDRGYAVETAEDGEQALEKARNTCFQILLTDLQMPKVNGMDVLREIKRSNPEVEVIVLSGYPTIAAAVEAIKIGAFDFICKPFDLNVVYLTIQQCLQKQQLQAGLGRTQELHAFWEITRVAGVAQSVTDIARRALEVGLQVTGALRGSLMLFDEQSQELRIAAAQGLEGAVIQSTRIRLGEGIAGRVLKSGEPLLVREIADELRLVHGEQRHYRSGSFLSVPLIGINSGDGRETMMGVLNVAEKSAADVFSTRDKNVLAVLAGQAAVAMQYCQLRAQNISIKGTDSLRDIHCALNTIARYAVESKAIAATQRDFIQENIDIFRKIFLGQAEISGQEKNA
ncbi:MAG: response regulator [Candidatus Omnitrophica bacterium]|nr:response regulator [Candidatus Omnitrophota bacterium]